MKELLQVVEQLRAKVQQHRHLLSNNEFLVRYTLIDPLLRALGWDTEDPDQVRPEETISVGRPDYALLQDGETILFVGAKALGKSEDLDKLISYCNAEGVPYFAATDGVRWTVYEVFKPVPTLQKKIIEFDLGSMDSGEVVRRSLALWHAAPLGSSAPNPLTARSTGPMTSATGSIAPHASVTRVPMPPPAGQVLQHTVELKSFSVTTRQRPPAKLLDPHGAEHPIKAWKDILVVIVEWLIGQQSLTAADCPVMLPRGSRHLVSTGHTHPNGKPFFQAVQVGSFWVETHASGPQICRQAMFLLERFGTGNRFQVVK